MNFVISLSSYVYISHLRVSVSPNPLIPQFPISTSFASWCNKFALSRQDVSPLFFRNQRNQNEYRFNVYGLSEFISIGIENAINYCKVS